MKTFPFPPHCFLAYLVLPSYCLGTAVRNEFVEYQSWADRGPNLSAADLRLGAWPPSSLPYPS